MTRFRKFAASLALLGTGSVLLSCSGGGSGNNVMAVAPRSSGFVETALINGNVYTVNPNQPRAEAVLIRDGQIEMVGTTTDIRAAAASGAVEIDLQGRLLLPGFHDVHAHPLEAMSPVSGTCALDVNETNLESYIPVLRACAPNQVGSNWIIGYGHSVLTVLDSQRPPYDVLDEAIPDQPAVMMEESSHSVWVNSIAMQMAGIDANTPNPPGGVIVKDSVTGEPTGLLFDNAGDLVMDLAWTPTDEIKNLNYDGLVDAFALLNQNGITSVVEGRTYWRREFQNAWLRAEEENTLSVRAVLGLWVYPGLDDEQQLSEIRALYRNDPDSLLRISQIKVYADGILINTTAAMLEPYRVTLGGIPSMNGLNYITEQRLTKLIAELEPSGFDFHIHAIGDRGVREGLNAIEAAQGNSARHRLTHIEYVDAADISRFAELGVIADMQVSGDFAQPEFWSESEVLIGDRASPFVALKSIYDTSARITLSSDWDVSTLNPFVGIQNSLTRSPQNLPNIDAAIRAYTINAAYVMRQETRTGSIEEGKRADMIVVDQDITSIPVTDISNTRVLMTFLDGRLVYER